MGKYDEYKSNIVQYAKKLSEQGYFGTMMGTGGNVSIRIKGENAIAVTPSGMSYKDLFEDDVCILDFDINAIEGEHKPSVESQMHIAAYKKRPDVNAVIHTHQSKASIYAIINHPIPPLFDEVCLNIGEIVDIVPYALSGTPQLVEHVKTKLGNNCHCYILQNHGVLSLGYTLDQALLNAELLEKISSIYFDALSTGQTVTLLSDETVNLLKLVRKDIQARNAIENETPVEK